VPDFRGTSRFPWRGRKQSAGADGVLPSNCRHGIGQRSRPALEGDTARLCRTMPAEGEESFDVAVDC
jgi:hypothetical protein